MRYNDSHYQRICDSTNKNSTSKLTIRKITWNQQHVFILLCAHPLIKLKNFINDESDKIYLQIDILYTIKMINYV